MSKEDKKDLESYKIHLANYWADLDIKGYDKTLSQIFADSLVSDGRKRNSVINQLAKLGYLNYIDGRLQISSKAFGEIEESKPDLVKILEDLFENLQLIPNGIGWEKFSINEKKYIFNHKNEFIFSYENKYFDENDHTYYLVKYGEKPPEKVHFTYSLTVRSEDFDATKEKIIERKKFRKARRNRLVYGLVQLGLLDKESEKEVNSKNIFGIFGLAGFGSEPDSWEEDINKQIQDMQKTVSEQIKLLQKLKDLNDNINNYGGWKKFLEDYDNLIKNDLKAESLQKKQ